MLPFKESQTVIIDPSILPDKLFFGTVVKRVYKQIGVIEKRSYFKLKRCYTYLVKFEDKEYWFLESEIL